MTASVSVLGIFAMDLIFRTNRLPVTGETVVGNSFATGPGGKGSNQAVAARRSGAEVVLISKLGGDDFGDTGRRLYEGEGISSEYLLTHPEVANAAAVIMVNEQTGDNSIIVVLGAAGELTPEEVRNAASGITGSQVFLTNLEVPLDAMQVGLEIAHQHQVSTILNPAPAIVLDTDIYPLCDYITPNETEAEILTGLEVQTVEQAATAAEKFREMGSKTVIITLGKNGVYARNAELAEHIPTFEMGDRVVDTTGAGDAFNGGFAAALAEGLALREAIRFGNAAAALSVTKHGTAPSMPQANEIRELLNS